MTQAESRKRWRLRNTKARNAERARNYRKHRDTEANRRRSHKPWTEKEIEIVMAHSGPTDPPDQEIARRIGRSVQAMQVMRVKVKQKIAAGAA